TRGPEAFLEVAARALPLIQFMLDRTLGQADLTTLDGRTRAVSAATPLLKAIQDPVAQEQYAHYVADRVAVSDGAVMAKLGTPAGRGAGRPAPVEAEPGPRKLSPQHRAEWEMLKL